MVLCTTNAGFAVIRTLRKTNWPCAPNAVTPIASLVSVVIPVNPCVIFATIAREYKTLSCQLVCFLLLFSFEISKILRLEEGLVALWSLIRAQHGAGKARPQRRRQLLHVYERRVGMHRRRTVHRVALQVRLLFGLMSARLSFLVSSSLSLLFSSLLFSFFFPLPSSSLGDGSGLG